VIGGSSERFLAVLRRLPIDSTQSRYWTLVLSGEVDAPFWFVRDEYVRAGLVIGSCLIDEEATLGEIAEYFGPDLELDRFRIATFPAEGLGGGFGSEWLEIANRGLNALAGLSPIEIVRYGFEGLGWVGAIRQVPRAVAKVRARGVRTHAARWMETEVASRRLIRYLRRRRRWETSNLSQCLEIDHRSAGALLRLAGFTLSEKDYRTWTRTVAA